MPALLGKTGEPSLPEVDLVELLLLEPELFDWECRAAGDWPSCQYCGPRFLYLCFRLPLVRLLAIGSESTRLSWLFGTHMLALAFWS